MNSIQQYLDKIELHFKSGFATEHSYRGDLQNLLVILLPSISVTNEPKKRQCGAPDFILTRENNLIEVGWIETKAIGEKLDSKTHQEQFDRYKAALHNLIITDYLRFDFHAPNRKVINIEIARLEDKKIHALPENFAQFTALIKDFANYVGQEITSAAQLSKIMAGKAILLADAIKKALNLNQENQEISSLNQQLEAFKSGLLHDLTPSEFADIYAQTIAYGLFTAYLHDKDPKNFSRENAAKNIPLSNPFLRKLFDHIAGINLEEIESILPFDDRIIWIVDSLAKIFRLVDTEKLMQNFGSSIEETDIEKNDPVIHFYETFLAEYDPKKRKSRGVWYTPPQIVNFIVRAVDDILKTEFNLSEGLANRDKNTIEIERNKQKIKKEIPKLQILDPATGTGTFLSEIVKYIYQKDFKENQQGSWSAFVEEHLIPRLNGFEILIASYAIAHLKLDLLFTETKYIPKKQQRFNIYLTNSLEEYHPDTQNIFFPQLSREANEANDIKRDTPVMVVMGNPPYSVSSSNKNHHIGKKGEKQTFDWIESLLQDYKKDLNEKNIQPLSDDYIKFIRYGSSLIEKNGSGILAYISNNSFIDGLIHRQMRKHLLETFDKIYILDLHGSNKKKETALDGSKDENVFDIMQGVSINLFIKTGKKQPQALAELHHFDLYGLREEKYQALLDNNIKSLAWTKFDCRKPEYFFIDRDIKVQKEYKKGFSINDLFSINTSGIKTHRDDFVIDINKDDLAKRIEKFCSSSFTSQELKNKFSLAATEEWVSERQDETFNSSYIKKIAYRPFDDRYIYYSSKFVDRAREKIMQHFLYDENKNIGLIFPRQVATDNWSHIQVTENLVDNRIHYSNKGIAVIAPLYLYPETEKQHSTEETSQRIPNLDNALVKKIARKLGLKFTHEKESKEKTFSPIDLLDYIYAVLHSPTYRKTYKEFLKIDFPRVPYPEPETFWQLVKLGGELRQLHLLENIERKDLNTRYPMDGFNAVRRKIDKKAFELTDPENKCGRVIINDSQYFDNVPLIAWEFYIGGYQPAQKWLKDRFGRDLSADDIFHYQKIIKALTETARIMQEIDLIMGDADENVVA